MCLHITVHNCHTQHNTRFSLLSSRQSSQLRWCLLEGRGFVYHYITISSFCLCALEVCALYGHLSCGWLRVVTLAMMGSGRGWLGAVVARDAAGRNGRCASTGGFLNGWCSSTAGFHTLQFKPQSRCENNDKLGSLCNALVSLIALTLLVGRQEGHPACKNGGMVEVGIT